MLNNTIGISLAMKDLYGDSANYEKGREYGAGLAKRIDTALIYSCDAYFKATDSLRFGFVNDYNKDSVLQLYSKHKDTTLLKTEAFYIQRARLDFLTGHYKDCLSDIEQASKSDGGKNALLIIKALALDRVGKFKEAAAEFYQLEVLSKDRTYLVHAAMENRKALEVK